MLYIVSTPIGNLDDITFRAIDTLKSVDLIAAEDTRTSGILLKRHNIKTPMISFHSYSDEKKIGDLTNKMREGKKIALISDAGTPGISDPGYKLIKEARQKGFKVVPIPGPSAFLTALSACGLPINIFLYLGFLPQKKGRKTLLNELSKKSETIVFYESPHRIQKTLKEFIDFFPSRQIVIARELTKIHEEFLTGTAAQLSDHFNKTKPKGEFTIIIGAIERQKTEHNFCI